MVECWIVLFSKHMKMSFTQYISANTQGITMTSATAKKSSINNTSHNVIFHVAMNAVDGASIETAIQYQLRVCLVTKETNESTEILVNPSQPVQPLEISFKYFYQKKSGENGVSARTIDMNDIYPLQYIHGDLYFSIPKTKNQTVVAHFVEFTA
jgi:hypothetical protein